MKYLIASDIHGSEKAARHIESVFNKGAFDMLILLGDVLYHGPRNNLPPDYMPKTVVDILNPLAGKIVACRGNCEAEVDQMLLKFPVLSDYTLLVDNGVKLFLTHGHVYNPDKLPNVEGIDIFLYGHTHVQVLERHDKLLICNPGSLSLPKHDSPKGYATYDSTRRLALYDINNSLIKELTI